MGDVLQDTGGAETSEDVVDRACVAAKVPGHLAGTTRPIHEGDEIGLGVDLVRCHAEPAVR